MSELTDKAAIMTADKTNIANTYARFELAIKSGKGSLVWDTDGKEYIDLGGGIAVNSFGIADTVWQEAVTAQVMQVQHTSNLYYTAPQVQLAEMLCKKSNMKKVFFSNSGAEANECAIKTARKYSSDKYGEGRYTIITLKNSFHGRTLATITATGQENFHTHFGPFLEGFVYSEPNDFGDIQKLASENKCCAVMLELIQGEGGVHVLEQSYVKQVANFCAENDILLIIDEVQTGNGRCGTLFAYQSYGIAPDIVSTAKGLAGGLPMGATLFGEKTAGTLTSGTHGSTFGGNPVCAAGAMSVLSRIDDALLGEVIKKGEYIKQRLQGTKGVISISGMGLMLGIETEKDAKQIVAELLDKGVIALTAKNKVRLLPALNIPWDLLEKSMNIITEVLAK